MRSIPIFWLSLLAAVFALFTQAAQAQTGAKEHLDPNVCSRWNVDSPAALLDGVAEPRVTNLALYCAEHSNGVTWYWFPGTTEAEAKTAALASCKKAANDNVAQYGAITVPCALYGTADRPGPAAAAAPRAAPLVPDGSCSGIASYRSENGDQPMEIHVTNNTGQALTINWINYDAQPEHYHDLAAGEQLSIPTYATHSWEFTDTSGACLQVFAVLPGVTEYTIGTGGFTIGAPQATTTAAVGASCFEAVQGKIAWDYNGNTEWDEASIADLCQSVPSDEPARCFETVMHGGVDWGGGTEWGWSNALTLCRGTADSSATIGCFQSDLAKTGDWTKAIAACSGAFTEERIAATSTTTSTNTSTATASATSSSFSLSYQAHFQRLASVDMAACGIEKGGFGGFGDRDVPTNSHGDVHIFTPDGLTYDFQAEGEFTLVASSDHSVAVHTRQTMNAGQAVSSNTAVAMKVGEDVVEFYSDKEGQRIYVNGAKLDSLPTKVLSLPGGGGINPDVHGKSGPRYLVVWPGDIFTARVNLYAQFLNVGVQSHTTELQFSGLIGNLDGNPKNDMLARGGAALICPRASADQLTVFGDSWRLSASETLLRSELSNNLQTLTVDLATGTNVTAETAIYTAFKQTFGSLEVSQQIDISTIIVTLTAFYDFDEATIRRVLARIFDNQEIISSETVTISVEQITKVVKTREERIAVRTIETVDITARAKAQQYCQVSGVTDQVALSNCILDVATTGNKTYLESAVQFARFVSVLPPERRVVAVEKSGLLDSSLILDTAEVVRIAGPAPDPSTDFNIDITPRGTDASSDINVTYSGFECAADALPDPQALLEAEPRALAVAVYCAQHERGWSVGANYGLTLDAALLAAERTCLQRAEAAVADWGGITQTCALFASAVRDVSFGGISFDDGYRLPPPTKNACAPAKFDAASVSVTNLSTGTHYFSDDGLEVGLPNVGEFLFVRSADDQVVVHARKQLWVSNNSKSVITAVHLRVGADTVEVQAAPEPYLLVNGAEADTGDEGIIHLPGGGSVISASANSIVVTWPCTSFVAEIVYFAGSHITIGVTPDPEMVYDGLVRFSERYMVTTSTSPFRTPVRSGLGCACEAGEPDIEVPAGEGDRN